jgi:hypothetical protein
MHSLNQLGFEIVPQLFDHGIMNSLIRSLETSPLRHSRAGIRNAFQIDSVRELASDARLIGFARSILGKDAVPFRATLFEKSFHSNWLVVWHQDTALPVRKRQDVKGWGPWSVKEGVICAQAPAHALEQVLAIRVHLDDSDAKNGSLRVLPQTHTLGVLSDDAIHDLATMISARDCHVPMGGILLMRPLLVHSSSKAKCETAHRRVLHIEYASCSSFPGGIELCSHPSQASGQNSAPCTITPGNERSISP